MRALKSLAVTLLVFAAIVVGIAGFVVLVEPPPWLVFGAVGAIIPLLFVWGLVHDAMYGRRS